MSEQRDVTMKSLTMVEYTADSKSNVALKTLPQERNQECSDEIIGIRHLHISQEGNHEKVEALPQKETTLPVTNNNKIHNSDTSKAGRVFQSNYENNQHSQSSETFFRASEIITNGLLSNQLLKDNFEESPMDLKVLKKQGVQNVQDIDGKQKERFSFPCDIKTNEEYQKSESSFDRNMSITFCTSMTKCTLDISSSLVTSKNANFKPLRAGKAYNIATTPVTSASTIRACNPAITTKSNVSTKEKELKDNCHNQLERHKHEAKKTCETGKSRLTKATSTASTDESTSISEFHNSLETDGPTNFQNIQTQDKYGCTQKQSHTDMNDVNETNLVLNGHHLNQIQYPVLMEHIQIQPQHPVLMEQHSSQTHHPGLMEQHLQQGEHLSFMGIHSSQIPHSVLMEQHLQQDEHLSFMGIHSSQIPHSVLTEQHSSQIPHSVLMEQHSSQTHHPGLMEQYSSQTHHAGLMEQHLQQGEHLSFMETHSSQIPHSVLTEQHSSQIPHSVLMEQHSSQIPQSVLMEQHSSKAQHPVLMKQQQTQAQHPALIEQDPLQAQHLSLIKEHSSQSQLPYGMGQHSTLAQFPGVTSQHSSQAHQRVLTEQRSTQSNQLANVHMSHCKHTFSRTPHQPVTSFQLTGHNHSKHLPLARSNCHDFQIIPSAQNLNMPTQRGQGEGMRHENKYYRGKVSEYLQKGTFDSTSGTMSYPMACSNSGSGTNLIPCNIGSISKSVLVSPTCNVLSSISDSRTFSTTCNTLGSNARVLPYSTSCSLSKGHSTHSTSNHKNNASSNCSFNKGHKSTKINSQMASDPAGRSNKMLEQSVTPGNLNHKLGQVSSDTFMYSGVYNQNPRKLSKDNEHSLQKLLMTSTPHMKGHDYHCRINFSSEEDADNHITKELQICHGGAQFPSFSTLSKGPLNEEDINKGTYKVNDWLYSDRDLISCREVGSAINQLTDERDLNLTNRQSQVSSLQVTSSYQNGAVGMFTGKPLQTSQTPTLKTMLSKKNHPHNQKSKASVLKHEGKITVSSDNSVASESFNISENSNSRKVETSVSYCVTDPTIQKIGQKKLPMYTRSVRDQAEENQDSHVNQDYINYLNINFQL